MHIVRRTVHYIQKEKRYLKYSVLQKLQVMFFSIVLLVEVGTLPSTFHFKESNQT